MKTKNDITHEKILKKVKEAPFEQMVNQGQNY